MNQKIYRKINILIEETCDDCVEIMDTRIIEREGRDYLEMKLPEGDWELKELKSGWVTIIKKEKVSQ